MDLSPGVAPAVAAGAVAAAVAAQQTLVTSETKGVRFMTISRVPQLLSLFHQAVAGSVSIDHGALSTFVPQCASPKSS